MTQISVEVKNIPENNHVGKFPTKFAPLANSVEVAAKVCGVDPSIIVSRNQKQYACIPRAIAMRLMRDAGASTLQIGRTVGRDHTTVISGLRRLENLCRTVDGFQFRKQLQDARALMEASNGRS